jgi:uncharacterized protein involved in cysteine biosynthesis
MLPVREKPGFLAGLASVTGAFGFLQRDSGTWPVAAVPALVFAALVSVGTIGGAWGLLPWLYEALGLVDPATWYATAGKVLVSVLSLLASLFVGVFVAFALTPVLSAPALERLVALQEAELGVPARREQGWLSELVCGFKAQLIALCVMTPLLVGLWLLGFFVPPAAVLTTPLQLLVVALGLAWNLFDIPLTLRGVSAAARIAVLQDHLPAVLGFGLAFSALFWIPCFGIVMLPVGAVAATRLVWRILESDPRALPELARPARLPPAAD